jgi:hypothetical protein
VVVRRDVGSGLRLERAALSHHRCVNHGRVSAGPVQQWLLKDMYDEGSCCNGAMMTFSVATAGLFKHIPGYCLSDMALRLAVCLAALVGAQLAAGACAAAPPRLVPAAAVTFESLDTPVLRARVMPYDPRGVNTTWAIEATCCGYGPFTPTAVNASSVAGACCAWPSMLPARHPDYSRDDDPPSPAP